MSNLAQHARAELEAAGWFDKEGLYDGMIGEAVMQLVRLFADQGHSDMSAGIVRSLFDSLSSFRPLGPLTGEDSEWIEVAEQDGKPLYQNRRCHRVFKCGGQAYDIDGIVWRDPDGVTYTNRESRVPVAFPYSPATEYRDVDR